MKLVLNLKIGIHGKGHTLWLDEFTTQETGCKTSESKGELKKYSINNTHALFRLLQNEKATLLF